MCQRPRRTFQISTTVKLAIVNHKDRLTVALIDPDKRQYKSCNMLSYGDALRLIGWLGEYINMVRPVQATLSASIITAHARGIDREKNKLLAEALGEKDEP